EEPELRPGVERPHRPRRSGRGHLRPGESELRAAARRFLGEPRSDGEGPPVLRQRQPVPPGDLLSRRAAEAARRGLQGEVGKDEALQAADADGEQQGRPVLSGRRLPPGLLQEEPAPVPLLCDELRALRAARQPVGRTKKALVQIGGRAPFNRALTLINYFWCL